MRTSSLRLTRKTPSCRYPFREDTNCTVTIRVANVNDVAPVFVDAATIFSDAPAGVVFTPPNQSSGALASYSVRLHEGTAAGTVLLRVAANDSDAPPFNIVRFEWGNTSAVPSLLMLNATTGVVVVTELVFNVDFGDTRIEVVAMDGDGLFARAVVEILYEDRFDHFSFDNTYVVPMEALRGSHGGLTLNSHFFVVPVKT